MGLEEEGTGMEQKTLFILSLAASIPTKVGNDNARAQIYTEERSLQIPTQTITEQLSSIKNLICERYRAICEEDRFKWKDMNRKINKNKEN